MKPHEEKSRDRNEDPITGEPGAHPVGVGIGATGGAAAGAAIGAPGGPAGVAVGAIVGGLAGGYAGKAGGEAVNPTEEDAYWEQHHAKQDYATPEDRFEEYLGAYRAGYLGPARYGTHWDEAEGEIQREWDQSRGQSSLPWHRARHAARAAWDRVESRKPADAVADHPR